MLGQFDTTKLINVVMTQKPYIYMRQQIQHRKMK